MDRRKRKPDSPADKIKKKYRKMESPGKPKRVKDALEEIEVGDISLRAASKKYQLSYGYLYRRFVGETKLDAKRGRPSVFNKDEERAMAEWLAEMAKRGMGLKTHEFLDFVKRIIVEEKRETVFTDGRPSHQWFRAFIRRNNEIIEKRVEKPLESSRAKTSAATLDEWFKNFAHFTMKEQITEPERIWNADETGFQMSSKSGSVIGPTRVSFKESVPHVTGPRAKERLTVMFAGSAAGQLIPPFYIYPAPPPKAYNPLNGGIPGGHIEYTKKGWMDSATFIKFLHYFSKSIQAKRPLLLLIDSVSSHIDLHTFQTAIDLGIELYRVVPNATHLMQPMDKGVFGPLNVMWHKTVRKHNREHPRVRIGKQFFAERLKEAYDDFYRPKTVINSFRTSGIYPLDRSAIKDKYLQPSLTYEVSETHTSETATSTQTEELSTAATTAFEVFESVLTTPIPEKYRRRAEEDYDIVDSPMYKTYRTLMKKTKTHSSCIPTAAATSSTASDISATCTITHEAAPSYEMSALDILADTAVNLLEIGPSSSQITSDTSTPCAIVPSTSKEIVPEEQVERVSPVIRKALVFPHPEKTSLSVKEKKKRVLDTLPDRLTCPDSVRKVSLSLLKHAKTVAEREAKAKQKFDVKQQKKKITALSRKARKKTKVRGELKELPCQKSSAQEDFMRKRTHSNSSDEAECMACGMTWGEDKKLARGSVWVECNQCKKWVHQECLPESQAIETLHEDFVCFECGKK